MLEKLKFSVCALLLMPLFLGVGTGLLVNEAVAACRLSDGDLRYFGSLVDQIQEEWEEYLELNIQYWSSGDDEKAQAILKPLLEAQKLRLKKKRKEFDKVREEMRNLCR